MIHFQYFYNQCCTFNTNMIAIQAEMSDQYIKTKQTFSHTDLSEVRVEFNFKASPIAAAPSWPMKLESKLIKVSINQMKSKQSITHFSEVKVWFNFKASPIDPAPSTPILLFSKLRVLINESNRNNQLTTMKSKYGPISKPFQSILHLRHQYYSDSSWWNWPINQMKTHLLQCSQSMVQF